MATYVPAYKGYVTDVPELWFKRRDKKIFHYDQLTAASFAPNVNFNEVNAGWSLYPVAYLPGQSTMEMQATSGQFNADLFAMANNQVFENKTYAVPYTAMYDIDEAANTVEIESDASIVDTIEISGMTKGDAAAAGVFAVAETAPGEDNANYKTVVTLFADDVNALDAKEIEITYYINRQANVIEVDNKSAAVGELLAKWPVYATGDESDAAGVKGYVLMKVYKCRVTAMPGFDTSYKSAATNSVTFSAMDPKRADEKVYDIAYIEK